jgi:two-component system sensor histidine kinase TctE
MPFAREQRSLFGEILDWMLAPLLLLWPMSVVLTWLVAQSLAEQPYDRQLGELARALALQVTISHSPSRGSKAEFSLPTGAAELLRTDESDTVYYQVLGLQGELVSGERVVPTPPGEGARRTGQVQLRDAQIGGQDVRVAAIWVDIEHPSGTTPPLVQVAETLGKRSQLAVEITKGVMLPQFVILPLAVLLVWLALARGIAPLNALQQRIRKRASHDLSPIDERDAPEEVSPLVRAINDLLARLDASMRSQKHFLADAAHQLKTPLAGLRTQAELIQREIDAGQSDPQSIKRSLRQMAVASQRAAHMVNQLLSMARAEDASPAGVDQPVNLARLAAETVRDFVPRAMEKRIDLGYEGPEPRERPAPYVVGRPVLLRELIRNLVDNALHYTPDGGSVTVRIAIDLDAQQVVLQVEDTGPGIPPAERELVFQPFYRALGTDVDGSGLGLAIVNEIAQRHHAKVTLEDARPRPPVAAAAADGMGPGAQFTWHFALLQAAGEGAAAPAGSTAPAPLDALSATRPGALTPLREGRDG